MPTRKTNGKKESEAKKKKTAKKAAARNPTAKKKAPKKPSKKAAPKKPEESKAPAVRTAQASRISQRQEKAEREALQQQNEASEQTVLDKKFCISVRGIILIGALALAAVSVAYATADRRPSAGDRLNVSLATNPVSDTSEATAPQIALMDDDDGNRARFGVYKGKTGLAILDTNGKVRLFAVTTRDGVNLSLLDENENEKITLCQYDRNPDEFVIPTGSED